MLSFFLLALNNLAIRIMKKNWFFNFFFWVVLSHFERCVIGVDIRGCSSGTAPSRAPAGPVPLSSSSRQCRVQARWQMDLFLLALIGSKKAHGNTLDGISGTEVSNTCFRAALYAINYRQFFPTISVLPFPPKMNRCLKTEDLSIKKE